MMYPALTEKAAELAAVPCIGVEWQIATTIIMNTNNAYGHAYGS